MSTKMNLSGFEQLERELKRMEQQVREAVKQYDGAEVTIYELFTDSFIQKYTKFPNLKEWIKSSGYKFENDDDFEIIPDDKLDALVSATTKFNCWDEILNEAAAEMISKKLDF